MSEPMMPTLQLEQSDFFELAQGQSVTSTTLDESARAQATFRDPAFASNKTLPIHRWVPWIAGFSSGFVQSALAHYLPQRGTVLDPFAGVGTTLVEAVLQLKGYTSRILRCEFKHLLKLPSLWTTAYSISTAGNVSSQTIAAYIQAQSTRA